MLFRRHKVARIAILGCGPAGLFAAHAFRACGFEEVTILSRKRRSEMFGAQYLHQPIPGLTGAGKLLQYQLIGTQEQYAEKVYGGKIKPENTSPATLPESHLAYDIREAYYRAWEIYTDTIVNIRIEPSMMTDIVRGYDMVVSTIPARLLCADMDGNHEFRSQRIWAVGDAPERGIFCPIFVEPQRVVCNGTPERGWYRASNVFGYKTAEWPDGPKPPIDNIASVEKPINTNCDCWPTVLRAGRYGTWTKGVLSHEVYYDTIRRYR